MTQRLKLELPGDCVVNVFLTVTIWQLTCGHIWTCLNKSLSFCTHFKFIQSVHVGGLSSLLIMSSGCVDFGNYVKVIPSNYLSARVPLVTLSHSWKSHAFRQNQTCVLPNISVYMLRLQRVSLVLVVGVIQWTVIWLVRNLLVVFFKGFPQKCLAVILGPYYSKVMQAFVDFMKSK